MHEKVNFAGWPNCIRLFNQDIEIIITTDIGPRIVRLGFIHGQNFFYLSPDEMGTTGGAEWKLYGGHRLWLSPEIMPLTYYPDNIPAGYSVDDHAVRVTAKKETTTGIVKEIVVELSPDKNRVNVIHRITNDNARDVELSPWGISALAKGGRAIIPQEPFHEGDDYLLPARSMALWHYTTMNDIRWTWGNKYIQAQQDPSIASEQKIGVLNKQGWAAYSLNDELLVKQFHYDLEANYPDFNCNNEVYINGNLLEIETLGPIVPIPPGGIVEHIEQWSLFKFAVGRDEESIDANILPLVNSGTL